MDLQVPSSRPLAVGSPSETGQSSTAARRERAKRPVAAPSQHQAVGSLGSSPYFETARSQGTKRSHNSPETREEEIREEKRRRLLNKRDWVGVSIRMPPSSRFPDSGQEQPGWSRKVPSHDRLSEREVKYTKSSRSQHQRLLLERYPAPMNRRDIKIRIGSREVEFGASSNTAGRSKTISSSHSQTSRRKRSKGDSSLASSTRGLDFRGTSEHKDITTSHQPQGLALNPEDDLLSSGLRQRHLLSRSPRIYHPFLQRSGTPPLLRRSRSLGSEVPDSPIAQIETWHTVNLPPRDEQNSSLRHFSDGSASSLRDSYHNSPIVCIGTSEISQMRPVLEYRDLIGVPSEGESDFRDNLHLPHQEAEIAEPGTVPPCIETSNQWTISTDELPHQTEWSISSQPISASTDRVIHLASNPGIADSGDVFLSCASPVRQNLPDADGDTSFSSEKQAIDDSTKDTQFFERGEESPLKRDQSENPTLDTQNSNAVNSRACSTAVPEVDENEMWKAFVFPDSDTSAGEAVLKEAIHEAVQFLRPSDTLDDRETTELGYNFETVATRGSESEGYCETAAICGTDVRELKDGVISSAEGAVNYQAIRRSLPVGHVSRVEDSRPRAPRGRSPRHPYPEELVRSDNPSSIAPAGSFCYSETVISSPSAPVSMIVEPPQSLASVEPKDSSRFMARKPFVGRLAVPKNPRQPVTTVSETKFSRGRKRRKGKRRATSSRRADIRELPNYEGDPIEEYEEADPAADLGSSLFGTLEME